MSDNPENAQKPNAEATKIDGVSAQINLSPGSDLHRLFARLRKESGAETNRDFIILLLHNYENPPHDADSAATIAAMERELSDLKSENTAYDATCQNQEQEINQLKIDLAAARNEANDNAAKATSIELANQGCIIIKPNPVVAYFLQEMAKETGKSPADILQALYIDDLQNPRANNLPYTVSASRIREVMDELKPQQN